MKIVSRVSTVDPSKCVGCRSCENQCPTNSIKVTKCGSEEHYVSPCQNACPAGVNVSGYVSLAGKGDYEGAYHLILKNNPFPSVCGRICTHLCQSACNRGHYDAPVAIMDIKRFVADRVYESAPIEQVWPSNGKSVAIIGAGPSGMTCAYYLALSGYSVDVYDAEPVAGGVLLYGVPEFRLPKAVLARDIHRIEKTGVKMHLSTEVGKDITFDELRDTHDCVYVATGTQFSRKAGVPGEDLEGVYHGLDFMKAVNNGNAPELGERVVIIGGGNTAIDTARVARRLGCKDVTILYRRRQVEMPADNREIIEALEEGVKIKTLTAPIEFTGYQKVELIRCAKMAVGEAGDDGRKTVHRIEGKDFDIPVDTVIVAVSQYSDLPFIDRSEVEMTAWGKMGVDENMMTKIPGVFSGGDVVRGSDTAITAIADGKRAAQCINSYLGINIGINDGAEIQIPAKGEYQWDHSKLSTMPVVPAEERVSNNNEVTLGLTEAQVKTESRRCYNCSGKATVNTDTCIDCQMCWEYCPNGAITMTPLEKDKIVKFPEPGLDQFDRVIEICKNAHFYPNDSICLCTQTKIPEVIGAIINGGAKTIEDVARLTGIRGGCGGMYCTGNVLRIMRGAGIEPPASENGNWYKTDTILWDLPEQLDDRVTDKNLIRIINEDRKVSWTEEAFNIKAEAYRKRLEEGK